MEKQRLNDLARKFLRGKASPEEIAGLHRWWDEETNNGEEQIVVTRRPETVDSVRERILSELDRQIEAERPVVRRLYPQWLVAATVLFAVAAVTITLQITNRKPAAAIAEARAIKPGGDKATLELSTGSGRSAFKIVRTPKGGLYQVQLADGSKVWLNAVSSIRYPTVFDKERQVELSGEAYFEVANDPARPFKVLVSPRPGAPACLVTVLGTAFDISSYSDESSVRTTLLSGSLQVASVTTNRSRLLKPGQQAILDSDHRLTVNNSPDSAQIMAWHEGLFNFNNDSIEEVMKQMARWFDVEVNYSGKVPEHFKTTLPRNADLYHDLQTLQKTGHVRFEVKGRTVTVFPH